MPRPARDRKPLHLNHIIRAQQFSREDLDQLFDITAEMDAIDQGTGSDILSRKIMATLFYEPSLRTRFSFEAAMHRLGGRVISSDNAHQYSSAAKGEILEDTIRTVENYAHVIVLRHDQLGAAKTASEYSSIPVINAGDGPGQHPTQALLDLYTIQEARNAIDGISIAMVGDMANGRTVRSLCYFLAKYRVNRIFFVAPDVVRMRDDIKEYLGEHGVRFDEEPDLCKVLPHIDVLYVTRIQQERFGDRVEDYQAACGKYVINQSVLDKMRSDTIIMHPLPRNGKLQGSMEIAMEVDKDPRARYFRSQVRNGMLVRMALLKCILAPEA